MKTAIQNRRRTGSILTALALALAPVAGVAVAAAPAAVADAPASSEQAERFEVDFLTGMIDHHHMAVMMSQMCLEKAVHDELIATCEDIIATQTAEIETMQGWLMDWYGLEHMPDMTGMESMHRLHDLDGEEFEIAFMRSMIRHHWGAIREAEKCLDRAEHEDLLAQCEEIKSVQLGEIEMMQTWLQEWYALPGGRPTSTA